MTDFLTEQEVLAIQEVSELLADDDSLEITAQYEENALQLTEENNY